MNHGNLYERGRLRDRAREMLVLALFIIAIAALSTLVMNLIVYPVTLFAINETKLFNFIMTDILALLVIIVVIFLIFRRIYNLRKNGLSIKEISRYMLTRPFYYLSAGVIFLIITSGVVLTVYAILSNNYYFLYMLTR